MSKGTLGIATPADGDFKPRRISATRGPVYEFTGRLLAEASSHKPGRTRWQECRLWLTEGGAWIAELVGASDEGRERDIVTVTVIPPDGEDWDRRFAAMDAFDWSTLARAMVREQLGWKMTKVIE